MSLRDLMFLILCEERGTLLVSRRTAPVDLSASRGRDSDDDSSDEKQSHDDKGKDPLEGNHLVKELGNSDCSSKDAKREAHSVILHTVSELHMLTGVI
jgi:hypothetical protein